MRDVDKSSGTYVVKNKKMTSLIKKKSSKIPLKNKITTTNMNQR